jgi:hypothetical protein
MSQDIAIGYPSDMERGRTLVRDLESLALSGAMKVAYNDGSAQTETSNYTEPSERDYKIPPDRVLEFWPVTEIGEKKLVSTGEVTVHPHKVVCADSSLDHLDRISWLLAFNNWGAVKTITFFPAPYKYMLIVTDGTTTHYYTVTNKTGPLNVELPKDMTGENSLSSPTMTIEIIFHDTDLEVTEAFVDGGSGTYYFAWEIPITAWADVYNTVDQGILGGIGFLANIGLSTLFDRLVDTFTQNEQLRMAANMAKVPLEVFGTSIATSLCLAAYYNWIEVDSFIRKGGLSKLINAAVNPLTIAGTMIGVGSGLIQNSMAGLLAGKAAGSVTTWMTTQSMLAIIDDVKICAFA